MTIEEIMELFRKSTDGLSEKETMSVEEIAQLMFGEEFENAKKNS